MTLKNSILAAAAAVLALMCTQPALADGPITEFRIGIMDHDTGLYRQTHETNDPDINLEVRFVSPGFLSWAFSPQPVIGTDINTGSGTSLAYAGLGWNFYLTDAVFIDFTLGGAIHNGETKTKTADSRAYGCRLNFHESFSLGYSFDEKNSIMLSTDHMSNASLCDENPGLSNLGIRYAYKF